MLYPIHCPKFMNCLDSCLWNLTNGRIGKADWGPQRDSERHIHTYQVVGYKERVVIVYKHDYQRRSIGCSEALLHLSRLNSLLAIVGISEQDLLGCIEHCAGGG